MLFNSLAFMVFFPVVTLVYYLIPHRYRWFLLLAASCFFYMYFIPVYILILFITIAIDYAAGIFIENSDGTRRRWYLLISILSTCLVLAVFKYYNFFLENIEQIARWIGWNYSHEALAIILPIGLSFHTFQSLSYVIEVYRDKQRAERNFGIYALYVMYYPQLVAGPIERPQNLLHQFKKEKHFRFSNFWRGLRFMIYGLFLKLVVADRLGAYVDAIYSNYDRHTGLSLLLATIFFAFQIYCDFAGYSSIALGASRMMGISLMTNFRRPYLSQSISAFWRRWHISLSTWFKDYLYFSLGGSKMRSRLRHYLNLIVTFVVSGFWHGANWTFVVWGGLNGIYLVLEHAIGFSAMKLHRLFKIFLVFGLICISWVFFRASSIEQAIKILGKICSGTGPVFVPPDPEILIYCGLVSVMVIFFETGYELFYQRRKFAVSSTSISNGVMLLCILLILSIGVFDGSQFIYFQF